MASLGSQDRASSGEECGVVNEMGRAEVRADTEVLHDTRCRCHGRDVVQGIAEVNRAVGDGR